MDQFARYNPMPWVERHGAKLGGFAAGVLVSLILGALVSSHYTGAETRPPSAVVYPVF